MRKKDEKPKVYCLYHEKTDCICIKAVTTPEQLAVRIRNRDELKKWNIIV